MIEKLDSGMADEDRDRPLPVVLLVEDEPLVAMVAEENLRSIGYEPVLAINAASALSAVTDGLDPSFAVIDMGLPDARGDELVHRLRAVRPSLPVVIVSGYAESDLRAKFVGDTTVAIVTKPYSEAQLARATRSLGLACVGY